MSYSLTHTAAQGLYHWTILFWQQKLCFARTFHSVSFCSLGCLSCLVCVSQGVSIFSERVCKSWKSQQKETPTLIHHHYGLISFRRDTTQHWNFLSETMESVWSLRFAWIAWILTSRILNLSKIRKEKKRKLSLVPSCLTICLSGLCSFCVCVSFCVKWDFFTYVNARDLYSYGNTALKSAAL